MDEEQGEKSFTVSDKRFSARSESGQERPSETPRSSASSAEREASRPPQGGPQSVPGQEDINFTSFLISLGTQAFMHLGEIPNPLTKEREKDLPAAKHMINLLGILEAKTKGNLADDEERLLRQLLLICASALCARQVNERGPLSIAGAAARCVARGD
jgi:hypothetical protein